MRKEDNYSKEELLEVKEFWTRQFGKELYEMELPCDFPGGVGYLAGSFSFTMTQVLNDKLKKMSKNEHLLLYIILLSVLETFIYSYAGLEDTVIATPLYSEGEDGGERGDYYHYNSFILMKAQVHSNMSFKELLMQTKDVVKNGFIHQYYPMKYVFDELGIGEYEKVFGKVILNYENIQEKISEKNASSFDWNELVFCFSNEEKIKGKIIYNTKLFKSETIKIFADSFLYVAEQFTDNPNIFIKDVAIAREENTLLAQGKGKEQKWQTSNITELFEIQVAKTPDKTAISLAVEAEEVYRRMEKEKDINEGIAGKCIYRINPYVFLYDTSYGLKTNIHLRDYSGEELRYLRTHKNNYIIVNAKVLDMIEYFNGSNTLSEIFKVLPNDGSSILIQNTTGNEHSWNLQTEITESCMDGDFLNFMKIVKALEDAHLIILESIRQERKGIEHCKKKNNWAQSRKITVVPKQEQPQNGTHGENAPVVLFLGATPGMTTVGLLNIASYLRRHGIEAYCQLNDMGVTEKQLEENIKELLEEVNPSIVGLSMKWFPHMARAVKIARLIKKIKPEVLLVLGGNTASHYYEKIMEYEFVDYIVRGDGEQPFLEIAQGKVNISNLVYRKDGGVTALPITYIEDKNNTGEIYLSHVDDIFVARKWLFYIPYYYVYTGKGCSMNCFYCAGCNSAQIETFNRSYTFVRGVSEVKRDIEAIMDYTSTLMFVDSFAFDTYSYHKEIWNSIDLSAHFCNFYFYKLPDSNMLELITSSYRYCYINIDLCTFSQRLRELLKKRNMLKPMPSDAEIIEFFELCKKYENIEVRISLISGLPFTQEEDTIASDKMLAHITEHYNCFKGLEWGRLQPHPGAEVTDNCSEYGMYSLASTYEDFYNYSEYNLNQSVYPDIYTFYLPFIYYKDKEKNSHVSKHYSEVNAKMQQIDHRKHKIYTIESLTYKELNERANQLAYTLFEYGISKNKTVGILLEHNIDMAVGILGVLKAGAAYIPMSLEYANERIMYMLTDCKAELLLVNEDSMREGLEWKRILNMDEWAPVEGYGTGKGNPAISYEPEQMAAVIYTSGTSGFPKGVPVKHKSIANYGNFRIPEYGFTENDRCIQLISFGFDGFGSNFYSTLLSGGELVLLDKQWKNIRYIKNVICEKKITNTSLIPSMLEAVISNASETELKSLRLVVLAAEKASASLIRMCSQKNSAMKVFNEYGPTENCIAATFSKKVTAEHTGNIGTPVDNCRVYILGKQKKPVPEGISGELFISGDGLSEGYWNNGKLTEEKFVVNPYEAGRKMYATGDRARWNMDGTLELLSRMDEQFKIRGFRVEPMEIESQINKLEAVKDSAVVLRKHEGGSPYICAFIVAERQEPDTIKKKLQSILPDYMIPDYVEYISILPKTVNGKVDRRELETCSLRSVKEIIPADPDSDTEKILFEIWSKLLNSSNFGIYENFFDIGGNSLLIMQMNITLESRFPGIVTITDIFEYSTIRKLALFIDGRKHAVVK